VSVSFKSRRGHKHTVAVMTAVVFDVNLSLDGFVAAPGITLEQPLGEGGEVLRDWTVGPYADRSPKPPDTAGALITGRRTYEMALPAWREGGPHPPTPVYVVTHAPPDSPPPDSVYTFVTDGIEAALELARQAAGERDVRIMGGAAIAQQYLAAGLVDEIVVHLVPVLLKDGMPMFENLGAERTELDVVEVIDTPDATHVRYRVVR
jgi:dihydrofolate reductase